MIPNPDDPTAMVGLSYAGMFVRAGRDDVLTRLAEQRFTGWLGPQEGDWLLVVPEAVDGPVAGSGRGLLQLALALARELSTVAVVARVDRDQVLRLDGWDGTGDDGSQPPRELGGYVSDPSIDAPDDDAVFAEPEGAHHAHAYAGACSRPEVGEELFELLAEELDTESIFESERLDSALRLLDVPRWLVSAPSLPRDVPGGPRRGELVRLGAGRLGVSGRLAAAATGVVRRRRRR